MAERDKDSALAKLARVVVPRHVRVVKGKRQDVEGYSYTRQGSPGGPGGRPGASLPGPNPSKATFRRTEFPRAQARRLQGPRPVQSKVGLPKGPSTTGGKSPSTWKSKAKKDAEWAEEYFKRIRGQRAAQYEADKKSKVGVPGGPSTTGGEPKGTRRYAGDERLHGELKPRAQVRERVYRDKPGYAITGRDRFGRKLSIFSEDRADAERIRENIKAGALDPTAHWSTKDRTLAADVRVAIRLDNLKGQGDTRDPAGERIHVNEINRIASDEGVPPTKVYEAARKRGFLITDDRLETPGVPGAPGILGTGGESAVDRLRRQGRSSDLDPRGTDLNAAYRPPREGASTPWGRADHVEHYAEGIDFVSTPGHGGFRLSPARVKEMHPAIRSLSGYAPGWYEEDVDWAAVAYTFPEEFAGKFGWKDQDAASVKREAYNTLVRWHSKEIREQTPPGAARLGLPEGFPAGALARRGGLPAGPNEDLDAGSGLRDDAQAREAFLLGDAAYQKAHPEITALRRIVLAKQHGKVGKQQVDLFTASALTQVYDKLSPKNQETFEKMLRDGKVGALAAFAFSRAKGARGPSTEDNSWYEEGNADPNVKSLFDELDSFFDGTREKAVTKIARAQMQQAERRPAPESSRPPDGPSVTTAVAPDSRKAEGRAMMQPYLRAEGAGGSRTDYVDVRYRSNDGTMKTARGIPTTSGLQQGAEKDGFLLKSRPGDRGHWLPYARVSEVYPVPQTTLADRVNRGGQGDRAEQGRRIDKAVAAGVTPGGPKTKSGHRPLYTIAEEISREWRGQKGGVNFAAKPYLDAMRSLEDISDMYGADDAESIVLYFLSNARSYTGPKAKEHKVELKRILAEFRKRRPGAGLSAESPLDNLLVSFAQNIYIPRHKSRSKKGTSFDVEAHWRKKGIGKAPDITPDQKARQRLVDALPPAEDAGTLKMRSEFVTFGKHAQRLRELAKRKGERDARRASFERERARKLQPGYGSGRTSPAPDAMRRLNRRRRAAYEQGASPVGTVRVR